MSRLIFVLIIIFTLSQISSAQEETNSEKSLQKCASQLSENYIEIPPSLQAPYSNEIKEDILSKNGELLENLFKFNLMDPQPQCQGSPEGGGAGKEMELLIQNNYSTSNNPDILPKDRNVTSIKYARTIYYFTAYGFLKATRNYYHPHNYCISKFDDKAITIRICTTNLKKEPKPPKIQKCCPMGMVVNIDLMTQKTKMEKVNQTKPVICTPISGYEWEPYIENSTKSYSIVGSMTPNYEYKPPGSACKIIATVPFAKGMSRKVALYKRIKILEDGQVYTRISGNQKWKKQAGTYCVDGFIDTSSKMNTFNLPIDNFRQNPMNVIIKECRDKKDTTIYSTIYFCGLIISAIFSLLIVIIYFLIWSKCNVHGWTIAIFSLCMFLNSLLVAMGHGYGLWSTGHSQTGWCKTIAILAHYFSIANFSWMTILNLDLWSTITSMTPVSSRSKGRPRFYAYCVFAFSVPLIVVTISLILETQFDLFDDRVVRPQYGQFVCNLDKSAFLYHSTLPNSILFSFDIIFALLTLKFLVNYERGKRRMEAIRSTKKSSELHLFMKLFVVMGFSWIFELISALATAGDEINVTWYWAIFDIYNMLQSIVLAWIFLVKRDIREKLVYKYPSLSVAFKWIDDSKKNLTWTKSTSDDTDTGITTGPTPLSQ